MSPDHVATHRLQLDPVVHPSLDDPVVTPLSEVLGGPPGIRSAGHPFWRPVRVLLVLTALTFSLCLVNQTSCYRSYWQDTALRYSHMCYSDLPYLYTARGFAERVWPYTDDPVLTARYPGMEYPVGISYFAYGSAWVTQVLSGSPDLDRRAQLAPDSMWGDREVIGEVRAFVAVSAVFLGLCALLATYFLAGVNPRRPWDAAGFALAPVLALSGVVNWDLTAVVLVAAALWAWSRDRPVLTGALIGLGTATKLYPLFLLGGVLVICVKERRWRELGYAFAAAAGSWLLVNAPAYLHGPERWRLFWQFNSERGADLGSLWFLWGQTRDTVFDTGTINTVSWIFFICWCLAVAVVGWSSPATPRLAQLGFLILAGFLIVNKVYSPQYVLWLLPLAALARPRWRDLLIWQAGEVFYFCCIWWYLGGHLEPAGGGTPGFYWLAIIVRIVAQLYLCGVIVRDLLRPRHDPVLDLAASAYPPLRPAHAETSR